MRSRHLLLLTLTVAMAGGLPRRAGAQTPRVLWEKRVAHAPAVAPVLTGDTLWVVGADRKLLSISALTGDRYWRRTLSAYALLPVFPLRESIAICLGPPEPSLAVLDRRSGHTRWHVPLGGTAVGLASDAERIVAVGSTGEVAAYSLARGSELWKRSLGGAIAGACQDRSLLFVLGRHDSLWCLELPEGGRRWAAPIVGLHVTAPVSCDSLVACASYEGRLSLFGMEDGREVASSLVDSPVVASPSFAHGWLGCAAAGGEICLVDLPSLDPGWMRRTGTTLSTGLLSWGDLWVSACLRGRMLGLTHERGTEAWNLDFRAPITHPPAQCGALLAAIDDKGRVVVYTMERDR